MDDVIGGKWLHASRTPASKDSVALFVANDLGVATTRHGGVKPFRPADTAGLDAPPLRVFCSAPAEGNWSRFLTSRRPWPVTVYFTPSDAGVCAQEGEQGDALADTPACLWSEARLNSRIQRVFLNEVMLTWGAFDYGVYEGEEDQFPSDYSHTVDVSEAISRVRRNLDLSVDDISTITGISRRSLFLWQKREVQPRPATARPLWRLHSLTLAVVEVLGETGARGWLNSGDPSPIERLLSGRIDLVEHDANRIIFRQASLRPPEWQGARPEADEDVVVATRGEPARASQRKPQSLRLGESNVRRRD